MNRQEEKTLRNNIRHLIHDTNLNSVTKWEFGLRGYKKYPGKNDDNKRSLIYKTHIIASGLVSTYGRNLIEAVKKRDQIAFESIKYMSEKTKGLSF